MRDEVNDVVALRGRVLGMAAHVQVEPGTVAEEHVAAASPGHHAAEKGGGPPTRGQPPLPTEGASNAVLVLEPEDSPVHGTRLRSLGAGRDYGSPQTEERGSD